ncbi:MAG: SprT family zinc-dependent metalloprotease [Chloroflexota bacterium]
MTRSSKPGTSRPGEYELTLNRQTVSYTVRRSARAGYVRLEVRPNAGLTVVIPCSYDVKQLTKLLVAKAGWILDKLARYGRLQSFRPRKELESGDTVPYLGVNLKVSLQRDASRHTRVTLHEGNLVASLGAAACSPNLVLERWYRKQAASFIKTRTDDLNSRLGLAYNRLVIRDQRTRWGSCSRKGNLSFNWRLMMAPKPVIDYVIIHELAHLRELNHSRKFWELVAKHCPEWREHKKWLKEHQEELAAIIPA